MFTDTVRLLWLRLILAPISNRDYQQHSECETETDGEPYVDGLDVRHLGYSVAAIHRLRQDSE